MRLDHAYDGGLRYLDDAEVGAHRLLFAVSCLVGDQPHRYTALLDTGSSWCVLPPDAAAAIGCDPPREALQVRLSTRLGTYGGWLERIELTLPAAIGTLVSLQATWVVSLDWPGPMVIGWTGCLERFRWAVDPGEQAFYFARL